MKSKNRNKLSYLDCRTCSLNAEVVGDKGSHKIVSAEIYCLACKCVTKSILHENNEFLYGKSYECYKCNNYIIYCSDAGVIYKDETYIDNNYILLRDVDHGNSHLYINDDLIHTINNIIEVSDLQKLSNKIKTIVTFS